MRRLVYVLLLVLIAAGMMWSFEVKVVKADGTVYVRADGSVDGTTSIWTTDNITYVFTANINASIVIERDNIILDGKGYVLQGPGSGTGIDLSGRTNVTVENIQVEALTCGVLMTSSSNNVVSGSILANDVDGIALSSSSGDVISGNIIVNSTGHGMTLATSLDNMVIGNDVTNGFIDIAVYSSSDNVISGNTVADGIFGGIYLHNSDYNNISLNNITPNNHCGIWLESNSDYNSIYGNNVTANRDGMGIFLYQSSNNKLVGNVMANSYVQGYDFGVDGSSISDFVNDVDASNTVEGKPVYYWIDEHGIAVPSDAGTVILVNCSGITVQNLNLTWNRQGVLLANTTNCSIIENNIANNCLGFLIWESSANVIYHNNLLNNSWQTRGDPASFDVWNNGYPSGGNYWSDYLGSDMYGGTFQNQTGNDGIGDIQYPIDANGTDDYPLMQPWPAAEIAVADVTPAKTITGPGYPINISVTVRNLGDLVEAFNVTVYAGKSAVNKTQITFLARNSITIILQWDTRGFAVGNYTIGAYADSVPNEKNVSDNSFTGKLIYISILGDLTGGTGNLWDFVPDGKVDTRDIVAVSRCFGATPRCAPPYIWNSNCDINNDGRVDVRDLAIVSRNFGH